MNKDGEIEWLVEKALNVEGSYSSNIQLRSVSTGHIHISGNPAKFLQGHNVFGTDDLKYLMGKFFDALLKIDQLCLTPTDEEYQDIQDGKISLLRVDINQSWLLESKADVLAWIRAAGKCAALRRRGKGQFSGDCFYFQIISRHWAVKCYCKGLELSANGRGVQP
jgi:II/X family phage/plasmid replication protein